MKEGNVQQGVSAIIGILENAVTGHIVSTPMPASTVEELTQLRTAISHRKEPNNNSAGGLS